MEIFTECPGCGRKPTGLFFGGPFDIYRCTHCLRYFCSQCPGSNHGYQCPSCGSTDFRKVGECR